MDNPCRETVVRGGSTLSRPWPRLLAPLRHRDFALLSLGETVSLLGDGFFAVALPFQVYELSDSPTALSLVGAMRFVPNVLFLLLGGLVTDHFDRRRVLFVADVVRAGVMGLVGLLALSGALQLWHLLVLLPFYGAGTAFFTPASVAILPDVVPAAELPQANAFRSAVSPLMTFFLGPAVGGLVVGWAGPGPAMLCDAASFMVSAGAVLLTRPRPRPPRPPLAIAGAIDDLRAGFRFVRAHTWCWATLMATALSLLAWNGPVQVLRPHVVKYDLHAGATGLGLILAAGGAGSILASIVVGRLGVPRRPIAAIFLLGSLGIAVMAGYGLMTALWQGMLVAFVAGGLTGANAPMWDTLLQRHVPRDLLGRVSSVDWFIFMGLLPLSLALAGPAAAVMGVRGTIVAGCLLGGALMGLFFLVPGVQDVEEKGSEATA